MAVHDSTTQDDPARTTTPAGSAQETLKVQGDMLVAKVKELLHEGNVRRITVKNDTGHTVMEIPVTAGVLVAVAAPVLTAVAAVAALAGNWQIEVHRAPDDPAGR